MSGERSPEETAALVSAMIQPSANKKLVAVMPALTYRRRGDGRRFKKPGKTSADSKFQVSMTGQNPRPYSCQPNRQAGFELSSALADDAELADTEILPQQDIVVKGPQAALVLVNRLPW